MMAIPELKLIGARVTRDARNAERADLLIRRGRIAAFEADRIDCPAVDVSGCLLLPGLINAHDHLELNLFPRLGSGHYENYVQWARDIYHPEESPVKENLAVPKPLRLNWGGLKNLLSGVTTVAHHNPYDPRLMGNRFPVRVVQEFGWAHSLRFSLDAAEKFGATPHDRPFVIHAAEGRDDLAAEEVEKLDAIGMLDHRTVLVHAIALKPPQLDLLRARKCSIIWCPSSNLFAYGQTLPAWIVNSDLPIALGTDSALTAAGDMRDEIAIASDTQMTPIERIFEMVTTQAAAILRLPRSRGRIQLGGIADLLAVGDSGKSPAETLRKLHPHLVMIGGHIRLISRKLLLQNPQLGMQRMQCLKVEHRGQYLVDADIRSMYQGAATALGTEVRLAGKRICI